MKNNIIKKKYLKGGILCFGLLLGASSLFAETKQIYKGSYKGKSFTIDKKQFFIHNRELREQLIKDGYNGLYGEDIYYKDNNFVKKIDNIFKLNKKEQRDIFNQYTINHREDFIQSFFNQSGQQNDVYQEFTNDFFTTTHNDKDFNDYFITKKIKYPFNYAIMPHFNSAMLVKTSNQDYYLCKVYAGQSFLIESKYISERTFNANCVEYDDNKQDGTPVPVNKVIIRAERDLPIKDEVGYFSTNTFIIEKGVLAEQNGGYKVFNYQGTLELESEEGFLPILKPYKDGEYNALIEKN